MNSRNPSPPRFATGEVAALIATLHTTEQRLEQLTAGEIDTVADTDGRTFVLGRAQEELRRIEAVKQAAILNALPAHIALLDVDGVILSVNEAWRQFTSANAIQDPGHAVGLNYLDICERSHGEHEREAQQIAVGIRSVLSGNAKSFALEYPSHLPAEHKRFQVTVAPLSDDQRGGAVVMHLDVSAARNTEESLRATGQLLDNIVENIPTAVQVKSVENNFRIQMWNKAAEAMYGVPSSEAIGKDVHDLWPQADADRMRAADLDLVATRRMQDFPDRLAQTRSRGDIRVHMRKVALLDAGGKATHLLVIADDMTAEQAAQARLRESEARFRSLSMLSSDWFWEQDADHRFISFSGGDGVEGWGPDQNKAVGLHRWDLGGVVPLSSSWEDHKALMDAHKPFRKFEYRRVLEDGRLQYVEASGEPVFDSAGRFTGYRGVATEITERKNAERELQRFRAAMDSSGDAIVLVDRASLRYVDVNQTVCDMTGYTRRELLGMTPTELMGADRGTLERDYDAIIADKNSNANKVDGNYRHRNGTLIPIETRRRALQSENGWIIVGTARDITERRASEHRIRRLSRVYAMNSQVNALIVRAQNREELFREACRIAISEGGFTVARVIERDAAGAARIAASSEVDTRAFQRIVDEYNGNPEDSQSLLAVAFRNGQPLISNDVATDSRIPDRARMTQEGTYALALLPVTVAKRIAGVVSLRAREAGMFDDEELRLLLDLVSNLSFALELMEKRERIDYLAYYDSLTGLANRSLFLERVSQHMRIAAGGGQKLAVFMVDLERFKNINDSLGRPAGDALLTLVAEWLTLRVGDAGLLARIGADHFALVLPNARDKRGIGKLVEKTLAAFLEHPFRLNTATFRVAAKVGIAVFPKDGNDAGTLLRNSEAALKKAKARGDHYLFYKQKMTDAGAGKLTLENQLRHALDNDEFVLHYQPKVSLADGKLTGAEALIRWNDPKTGLVPPGRFIPILEETGLIHDVGRWAMHQAIEDYLRWLNAGLPAVRVAVNVSPMQLRNPAFIAEIGQAIGVDPRAAAGLELEITESLIMKDVKHSIDSLQVVRAMGVTIAIDDFGTGFSSLSHLARLPVDTLKIDRSFVTDMTVGPEGLALVSTIINLAHSMKLKVVAEGVENEEQSRLLRLLRCDQMQGFLFSKPVPADVFEKLFLAAPMRAQHA